MATVKSTPIQWGDCVLEDGDARRFACGPLDLWLRREADEILLATLAADSGGDEPEPGAWSRWATPKKSGRVILNPRLPDRPVVVEPEAPFHVVPHAKARIFVLVPLTVSVELPDAGVVLQEFPVETLSQTWFGEAVEGELCYWISTKAWRKAPDLAEAGGSLAVAPVRIRNRAEDDLPVDRICLRVGGLELFQQDGNLWTNETRVTFRGGGDRSEVTIRPGPPEEAAGSPKIGDAREAVSDNFFSRTFRSLTHWRNQED